MQSDNTPEQVVQRQLNAYNNLNLDAWLATYAPDARQYEHPATLLASGHEQIRARTAPRFQEPNLHARLIQRAVIGNLVVDYEQVTRSFPEGLGSVELTCIYEVRDGLIQTASFIFGKKTLHADT